MKSRHLPIALFRTTLIATCLLLLAVPGQAQFQRFFGTALDESFSEVVSSGSSYYVLGSGEITDGQPARATVTRLDAAGELVWTLSLNTASAWTAAVLTPAGNLLVVGHTLPEGPNSKSIMGSVTATGTFAWVRSYDNPGNDAFLKIVKNPSPQNPSFPYYVLGSQTDAMTMNTDMVLLNVDGSGNINYIKLYTSSIFFSGNKYARDLEALPNGDLLIAVNQETQGVVMRTDNAGQPFSGASPEFPFSIIDLALGDGGDVYAVGKDFQNSQVHLMKFDADLIGLWDYTISGMSQVSQVLHAAANGDLYVAGKKASTLEPCVFRFTENDGTPELVDVKLLNGNATSQSGGTLSMLSGNQLAFADGRSIPVVGFGDGCAFVGVTDLDLNSCVASNGTGDLQSVNTIYNGPELPEANFYEIPLESNLTGSMRAWQQGNVCSSEACVANFTFAFPNCDPTVSFTNTSTGPAPLSYLWNFGYAPLGIPQTSVAVNPFHTFPAQCATYNVCLTVTGNGCSNTICKNVVIKYTQTPVLTCPPNITVRCNTNLSPAVTGFATLTGACSGQNPNITFSDNTSGIMPCNGTVLRTWTATDNCGNEANCVQNIVVMDNVPPIIACPQDLTVNTNPGQCYYTGVLPQPTATDNCNSNPVVTCYLVTNNGLVPITPQTQFPKGTNTICCIADDGCVDVSDLICTYPCSAGGNFQEPDLPMQLAQDPNNSPTQQLLTTLAVQAGISGNVLVKDILVGGNCFDISNVTTQGQASQFGTFSNGQTNIGFDSGVILATGPSTLAIGPNNSDAAGSGVGGITPDADLATLTAGTLYDRASLEFDFIPTQSTVSFSFAFASEEYCARVGNAVTDVLGFFISGPGIPAGQQNIALVPASTTPVNANTVSHLNNGGWFVNNQPATSANLCGQSASTSPAVNEIQYDGFTRPFTALATVQPGQTYHLKLAIADAGDDGYDSAVFFRAGSFDAGGNAAVEWVVNSNPVSAVAYENCGTVNLVFDRVGVNLNVPLPVAYTITGSATAGLDYAPFASSIVIPAGQNQFTLPVTILNDAILEGDETIVITLNDVCSFLLPQKMLTIKDKSLLQAKCTFTLTVEDHERPTITCRPNVTVSGISNGAGSCTATVAVIGPTASDNCPMLMVDYAITGATTANGTNNASGLSFSEGISTVTYTATDMSGNMATCQTVVTVVCDFGSTCDCPAGGSQGPNQIVNGDFSAGNTGFTSDYNFSGTLPGAPGTYAISTSAIQLSSFWDCLDHTNGTLAGKFLTADASLTPGQAAWRQNVSITPSTEYQICAYANNLRRFFDNSNDPDVQIWMVDGNNTATLLTAAVLPEVPDFWVKLTASWTAPAVLVNPYRLEIRSGSTLQGGNDFAIDDISFKACSAPPPCDVTLVATYVDNCGHVQINAVASGPSSYSYQWCSGESTQMLDLMLPCGSHDFCVTVTCADGSEASDAITVVVTDNIPPTINCPQDMTITALHPNCDIPVHGIHSLGATDNCGVPTVTYAISGATTASGQGDASGTTFNSGTSTVAYTATGWCNNMTTCSFDVTIECDTCSCLGFQNLAFNNLPGSPDIQVSCDSLPVMLPCIPSDGLYWFQWTLLCSDPLCLQSVDYEIVSASGGPALVSGTAVFSTLSFGYGQLAGPGNYQLILTGHCGLDVCTCVINFSVPPCCECGTFSDLTYRPAQGAPNMSVACGDSLAISCSQTFEPRIQGLFQCVGPQCPINNTVNWVLEDPLGNPVQNGSVSGPNFTVILTPSWFDDPGTYTLTISGQCGGQPCSPCVFYITSEGCLPTLCEASFTVNPIDNCGHVQLVSTSTGQQPISYQWSTSESTPNIDLVLPCGPHTFSVSITCADGSMSSATQTFNITDNIPPTIVCPQDMQLTCGGPTAPAATGFATATDNCSILSLTFTDVVTGTQPCNQVITRTWRAVDWCNNVSICVQTITVMDNIPPVLANCPQNMTVNGTLDPNGVCTANVQVISPTATDNCDQSVALINSFNNTADASGVYPNGTTTVTWTATDDCGNTATCAFDVTVDCSMPICCPEFKLIQQDSISPCPGDITCVRDSVGFLTPMLPSVKKIACKNSLHNYYIVPNLPGFTYTWTVTGGTPASFTGNPGVITWGSASEGYLEVVITDASGMCRDTITQEFCLLDSPTAAFTVAPIPGTTVCTNQPVTFTNTSVGGNTYHWDFGDNSSSTAPNPPPHSYPGPGTYTVLLTVSNGASGNTDLPPCGCIDTATAIITVIVGTGPTITSGCKEMLCPGDFATYCTDSGCAPYNWTVNGGTINGSNSGNCITVQWDAAAPATLPAFVSVTTGCVGTCGNSATLNVPVLWNNMPISGPNPVCAGSTATYSLPTMPGTSYTWAVNGVGASILGPSQNTPAINVQWTNFASTPTTITCVYDNPFSGCSGSTSLTVNVKAKFTIGGLSPVCQGTQNVYSVTSGGTATWLISPGIPGIDYTVVGATAGVANLIVNWITPGSYTITATPTNATLFCNLSATINVVVNPAPVINIAGLLVVCPNQLSNYNASSTLPGNNFTWSFNPGSGTISPYGTDNAMASVNFTGSGSSWTLIAMQDVKGCLGSATLTATPEPPPALPTASRIACIGGKITIQVLPGSSGPYTWSTSPAVSLISPQGAASAMYEVHGVGNIWVSNCGGKSNVVPVSTTLPAALQLSQVNTLCSGNAQLTTNPLFPTGTTYQWFGGGTPIPPNSLAVTKPGTYTVQATAPNGCISAATFTVPPEIIPTVSISTGDALVWCIPSAPMVTLQAFTQNQTTGCTYQWYNAAGPIIGATGQSYLATAAGSYYVVVSCGACVATSKTITVYAETCVPPPGSCNGVSNPLGPIMEVQGSPATRCNPKTFTVQVTGCPGGQVDWTFGDGTPIFSVITPASGINTSPVHIYANAGVYAVTASIFCNGCGFLVHTKTSVPVIADFNSSVVCGANGSYTITFNNISQTLGGWTFAPSTDVVWTSNCGTPLVGTGNSFILNTSPNCNPTVTMDITVNAAGQSCTDRKTITLNLPTQPLSIAGSSVVCKDQTYAFNYSWNGPTLVQYQWLVNSIPVSQEAVLNYAFGTVGNATIDLTAIDIFGCTYTATTYPVMVVMPGVLTLAPVMICPDCSPPAILSATPTTGFTNYQWYQNGVAISGANSATYQLCQFDASGNYHVTAEDTQFNNCMVSSDTVAVTYYPKPKADIEGQTTVCVSGNGPYTVPLSNAGANNSNYTYNWAATGPGTVTLNPNNLYNVNASVSALGTYQFILSVTDNTTGCMAKDTFCVYLCPKPTASVSGPSGTLCEGMPYTFTASATPAGNYVYVWSNGITGSVMTTSQAGNYMVTATDTDCGCSDDAYAGYIEQTPSTILFPVGCDTICDTGSITPPLIPNAGTIQWFVNNVPTPFFTGLTLNLTGNVVSPLVYGLNNIYIVVTYQGCSDTSNVYNLFISPCCVCKSELALFHGNVAYPVSCDSHMGFIPSLPCPAEDVLVSGYFGFADPTTGEPCEETPVSWELVRPDLSTLDGTTTNFTSLTFLKDSVDAPGLYCLNLLTISPDGLDTCVCKVTWIRESCVCCGSEADFCENLANNVTLSVDETLCTATVSIGNFNGCGVYIDWIDWNYPSVQQGPYSSGSTPTHTYPGSGTYTVCYSAVEIGDDGLNCNEKLVCETITLDCQDCYCGTFSGLFFPLNRIILGSPTFCEIPEVSLICPLPGKSIQLTGSFQCAGPNCPPTAQVSWELYRLPNTSTPVAASSTTANPYFTVNILPTWYAIPGSYELRLVGHCGVQECPCVVRFRVDCPDPCPCDEDAFNVAVHKGFTSMTSNLACKACFAPVALSDCDSVSWHIGSVSNPPVGATYGNQTFCHTFASSGTYTIVMSVIRKKSDGTVCAMAVKSRTVQVICTPFPICDESVFDNPGFNLGAEGGVLGSGGTSSNWMAASGEPVVIEGAGGSLNAWTISLAGNFEGGDALAPLEPICLERDTGLIILRAKDMTSGGRPRPCDRIVVGLERDGMLDDNLTLATISLSALDWGEWYDIEIPYDLNDYPEVDACGNAMQGALVQPVVYVTNALVDEQGGIDTRSTAQIDYFCFGGRLLTKVDDPKQGRSIHLFPNPTTGELTLRFDGVTPSQGQLQILDLYGRVVQKQSLAARSAEQVLSIEALPAGVYFVKILDEGIPVWTGKVIKQ